MPITLPYDSAKRLEIKRHMKLQEEDAGGIDRMRHDKFEVKGQVKLEPIYHFSHKELAFNKANGRIRSEILEKEEELGRALDIWDKSDEKIVKDMLLSIRKDENQKVKEDIRIKGQIRPGIITCDGIVINGNRRKALLDELYNETSEEKYKYLEVHVLPSDITKSELWLIEAGIQMSTPQQLDYTPINNLLKLKEGMLSGLRIEDMAARIYGVDVEKIKFDLERLELIDEYLRDFIGKPGKYYLIKGLAEHFIDLQNILSWAKKPRGPIKRDWSPDENDINELKLTAFYYIRGGFAHLRIRDMRDLFAKREAWKNLRKSIELDPEINDVELSNAGLEHLIDTGETEEEDEDDFNESSDEEGIQTSIEKQDLQVEAVWKATRKKDLKVFYEDAKEQEKIIKDTERPIVLAQRALNNIIAIPQEPEKLNDPEIDSILQQIIVNTDAPAKSLSTKYLHKLLLIMNIMLDFM